MYTHIFSLRPRLRLPLSRNLQKYGKYGLSRACSFVCERAFVACCVSRNVPTHNYMCENCFGISSDTKTERQTDRRHSKCFAEQYSHLHSLSIINWNLFSKNAKLRCARCYGCASARSAMLSPQDQMRSEKMAENNSNSNKNIKETTVDGAVEHEIKRKFFPAMPKASGGASVITCNFVRILNR